MSHKGVKPGGTELNSSQEGHSKWNFLSCSPRARMGAFRPVAFNGQLFALVNVNGGAGGNRTPVHQALFASDTTIPVVELTQPHRRVD